jgi:predicted acetyltransferase
MLTLALPVAHGLGLDPVLITCDVRNMASRRVIERNGGRLVEQEYGVLRFWLATSGSALLETSDQ